MNGLDFSDETINEVVVGFCQATISYNTTCIEDGCEGMESGNCIHSDLDGADFDPYSCERDELTPAQLADIERELREFCEENAVNVFKFFILRDGECCDDAPHRLGEIISLVSAGHGVSFNDHGNDVFLTELSESAGHVGEWRVESDDDGFAFTY